MSETNNQPSWHDTAANLTHIQTVVLPDVDSTNAYCLRNLATTSPCQAYIAKAQHDGRGRRERKWVSNNSENLYLTLGLSYTNSIDAVANIALEASSVIVKYLRSEHYPVYLKWPNDIYTKKGKVGGILAESRLKKGVIKLALGVGLNWEQPKTDDVFKNYSPSSLNVSNPEKKAQLTAGLIQQLSELLSQKEVNPVHSLAWPSEFDYLSGREIMLEMKATTLCGDYLGTSSKGELKLKSKDTVHIVRPDEILHCKVI